MKRIFDYKLKTKYQYAPNHSGKSTEFINILNYRSKQKTDLAFLDTYQNKLDKVNLNRRKYVNNDILSPPKQLNKLQPIFSSSRSKSQIQKSGFFDPKINRYSKADVEYKEAKFMNDVQSLINSVRSQKSYLMTPKIE